MHRKVNPYSCIEEVKKAREEVWGLILFGVLVAIALGLITNMSMEFIPSNGPSALPQDITICWRLFYIGLIVFVLVSLLLGVSRLYGTISRRIAINLSIPYNLFESKPDDNDTIKADVISELTSGDKAAAYIHAESGYKAVQEARDMWRITFEDKDRLKVWEEQVAAFKEENNQNRSHSFIQFIYHHNRQLVQGLVLRVLQRYGKDTFGYESYSSWWKVDFPSEKVKIKDMEMGIRENLFIRTRPHSEDSNMLLPEHTTIHVMEDHWEIVHRWYGTITIRWIPYLTAAGKNHRDLTALLVWTENPSVMFTMLKYNSLIKNRIEVTADLKHTLGKKGRRYVEWATGLLGYLEEALDFDYYISNHPQQISNELEWKIGYFDKGDRRSFYERIKAIEQDLAELKDCCGQHKLP